MDRLETYPNEFISLIDLHVYKANLPTGSVTFLFTDIEGSTKLAQQYPDVDARSLGAPQSYPAPGN